MPLLLVGCSALKRKSCLPVKRWAYLREKGVQFVPFPADVTEDVAEKPIVAKGRQQAMQRVAVALNSVRPGIRAGLPVRCEDVEIVVSLLSLSACRSRVCSLPELPLVIVELFLQAHEALFTDQSI